MKKTTTYARKRLVRVRQQEHDRLAALIIEDLEGLQRDAEIHTWMGDDGSRMVNLSGRLCFIAAHAANSAKISEDHPDIRIIRGMSEALEDMVEDLGNVDKYRASIRSGLAAIGRILPECTLIQIVEGHFALEDKLNSERGLCKSDIQAALTSRLSNGDHLELVA